MRQRLQRHLNIADLREAARRRLPRPVFDFLDGGAEDEVTLTRNRTVFSDWALVPHALNDVSQIDPSVRVLGEDLAWPYIVGPTGMPALFHADGEIAVAKAAARCGALYSLSTMASRSIEEVAAVTSAPKAFQLYIFRDRGLTRELIERAKAAGYRALILTVDIQVPANRERDKRTGMTIPPRFTPGSMVHFAAHPFWCLNQLRHPLKLANFDGARAEPGTPLLSFINSQFEPATTWYDLEWVAGQWGGPLAIKGILRADDAVRAVKAGASAVILSNHGGRQMDAAITGMDVVEETAAALGNGTDIIVDGGIRRGSDMLKAMALGATACMAGRPGLYGLAAAGAPGVDRAFEILRTEYMRGMGLLGVRNRTGLDHDCIRRVAGLEPRILPASRDRQSLDRHLSAV